MEFQVCKMKRFWRWMVVRVVQQYECTYWHWIVQLKILNSLKGKNTRSLKQPPDFGRELGVGAALQSSSSSSHNLGSKAMRKWPSPKDPLSKPKWYRCLKSGLRGAGHNIGWRGVYSKTDDYCWTLTEMAQAPTSKPVTTPNSSLEVLGLLCEECKERSFHTPSKKRRMDTEISSV